MDSSVVSSKIQLSLSVNYTTYIRDFSFISFADGPMGPLGIICGGEQFLLVIFPVRLHRLTLSIQGFVFLFFGLFLLFDE